MMGMVSAFSEIAEAGSRVDTSLLAGGIWEALITTIGGLAVAIPALAAYHILDGYIEKTRNLMKDYAIQTLNLLSDKKDEKQQKLPAIRQSQIWQQKSWLVKKQILVADLIKFDIGGRL